MKKKEIDPGLAYLKEIGFERMRGERQLIDRWTELFGDQKANELVTEWRRIGNGTKEFYQFKNSNPTISRSFVEAYDGDIIRKACNYIVEHKEYFGKTILEVGCDAGYMTGFLAKEFPDAEIVAIDRSDAALSMAQERLYSLGIKNVVFKNCALDEVTDSFDTVFCMRTIHENVDQETFPYCGEPLSSQFQSYEQVTSTITTQLVSRLNPAGYLCIFERFGDEPLICGWMLELNKLECAPILSTAISIKCEENGDQSAFQAFVCKQGTKEKESIFIQLWYDANDIDPSSYQSRNGYNILAFLANNAGKMLRGVRAKNRKNETVGRFAVFYNRKDESQLYYLLAVGKDISLYPCPLEAKQDVLSHLLGMIDHNVAEGHHFDTIEPNEPHLEGYVD